jgi:hypothetical protein
MLEQLLGALAEGGVHRHSDLARSLGVGEGLVQQMVEDLVRMGYLEPLRRACYEKCTECATVDVCVGGTQGQAWTLTRKGSLAAAKVT